MSNHLKTKVLNIPLNVFGLKKQEENRVVKVFMDFIEFKILEIFLHMCQYSTEHIYTWPGGIIRMIDTNLNSMQFMRDFTDGNSYLFYKLLSERKSEW